MSKMEFLDPVVAEKYQILYQILLGSFFWNTLIVELLRRNVFKQAMEEKNKVVLGDGEIKLINKSVKGK